MLLMQDVRRAHAKGVSVLTAFVGLLAVAACDDVGGTLQEPGATSAEPVETAPARPPENPEREQRRQELLMSTNPIAATDSPWIDELTWLEVRDRIAQGFTTAIIPTGGIEQNGPFVTTGKHNVILRAACPAIVQQLGNALCVPVVKFVPEGSIDPPSGAMFFPGTISVREETYQDLLDDIASSLKQHGFTDIVMIGDSGGNLEGMETVAQRLNKRWTATGTRAHFVREYYDPGWEATERYTEEVLGIAETQNDGHHDDIWVTAMMMITDPTTVRYNERVEAGLASINGVSLRPLKATVELGRKMMAFRAALTAEAIRGLILSR